MRTAVKIAKAIRREFDWWIGFLFLLPMLLLSGLLIQMMLDGYRPFLVIWLVGILTFGLGGRLGTALMRGQLRERSGRNSQRTR